VTSLPTFPPLGPISKKLNASQLKWSDFTKAIPFSYTEIQEVKAWAVFMRAMVLWGAFVWCGLTLFSVSSWTWYHFLIDALICVGIFCCYANLFVLAHDCGHFCFSKSKLANKFVGHFILSVFHIGFHNWKIGHNFHHVYSQTIGRDTTWTKDKMTVDVFKNSDAKTQKSYLIGYATLIGVLVGYYFSCVNYFFFVRYYKIIPLEKEQKRQLMFSSFLVLVFSLGHLYLFYRIGGIAFYFNFHLVPLMFGAVAAVGIPLLQHAHKNGVYFDKESWTPMRGQILGTYNFRMPYFWERVFNDVNLHVGHHINPKVPWYNLRKVHNELKTKFPDYIFEYDLTWDAIKGIYANPLAEWDAEFNLYRSVPVPEKKLMMFVIHF
tara:strand:- start:4778 stop:5911 length:1134 start_codon:yes stop_codon:yes gene_type:complete